MEYFILLLGFCLILIGIIGSVLPVLPGLPISWLGLLSLFFVKGIAANYWLLGLTLFFTLVITIIDYFIPAQGTKKFGGTKYGIWGTNIGMLIGFFLPIPLGFLIGAFVGAFIGEYVYSKQTQQAALKAAFGSFMGFIAGTFMKVFYGLLLLGIYFYLVIENWKIWF